MYIKNGYVYASCADSAAHIEKVELLGDRMMILTFSTGERRLFDAAILRGPVFVHLQDPEIFKRAQLDHGVVTWMDGDIDCAPEYMYANSYEYSALP